MAADIGEILGQMITDMLDDSELVGQLGAVTNIFRQYPAGTFKHPILIVTFDTLNSQTQFTGTGVYRPEMTFDIFVINPWSAGPVYDALESRWSIPIRRDSPIVSTDFVLDQLMFSDMIEIPGRLTEVDTGVIVRQFAVPASARIIKTS